jgi:hypothetical protein
MKWFENFRLRRYAKKLAAEPKYIYVLRILPRPSGAATHAFMRNGTELLSLMWDDETACITYRASKSAAIEGSVCASPEGSLTGEPRGE